MFFSSFLGGPNEDEGRAMRTWVKLLGGFNEGQIMHCLGNWRNRKQSAQRGVGLLSLLRCRKNAHQEEARRAICLSAWRWEWHRFKCAARRCIDLVAEHKEFTHQSGLGLEWIFILWRWDTACFRDKQNGRQRAMVCILPKTNAWVRRVRLRRLLSDWRRAVVTDRIEQLSQQHEAFVATTECAGEIQALYGLPAEEAVLLHQLLQKIRGADHQATQRLSSWQAAVKAAPIIAPHPVATAAAAPR